jgi:hypothetical protein
MVSFQIPVRVCGLWTRSSQILVAYRVGCKAAVVHRNVGPSFVHNVGYSRSASSHCLSATSDNDRPTTDGLGQCGHGSTIIGGSPSGLVGYYSGCGCGRRVGGGSFCNGTNGPSATRCVGMYSFAHSRSLPRWILVYGVCVHFGYLPLTTL